MRKSYSNIIRSVFEERCGVDGALHPRYRHDPDLDFLGRLKSEDLNDLLDTLTRGKDGSLRLTEEVTTDSVYMLHSPDHARYWSLIAAELQCYGGNAFATLVRGGKGVLYKEVLIDVCKQLKVNFNKHSDAALIERNMLDKLLEQTLDAMTEDEKRELARNFGARNWKVLSGQALTGTIQMLFRKGGFKSYQLTLIMVNAVTKALLGHGLSLAGNRILAKSLRLMTGPAALAFTVAWSAVDLAGPAYRVTMPAVLQVALLRQAHLVSGVGVDDADDLAA